MSAGEEFYSTYLAICILNAFVSYTAIMLNIVTIHAIRKTPQLSKTLKILLLNLSVSDLGVGLMAGPLHTAALGMKMTQNIERNKTYNLIFIAYLIPTNLFGPASCLLVTVLIADRFLSIHSYLRYQQLVTHKRVSVVVISIWVFSAILTVHSLYIPTNIKYAIFSINIFLCVTTVTFLSFKTYLASRSHINQIQTLELTAQQEAGNGELVNVARLRKFAMAAVYVCLVFLVCYLPHFCILCTRVITSKQLSVVLHQYSVTMVFLSSSLNPLIYCWKMKHIRQTVVNILRSSRSSHH